VDVLAIIKEDHEAIRTKFAVLRQASGVKKRREAFQEFLKQTNMALALGRVYLFPELDGLFNGADAMVSSATASGMKLEKCTKSIQKILAKPVAGQKNLDDKIDELEQVAQTYLRLVEELVMPKIRTFIRTEDREDLAEVFNDAKEDLEITWNASISTSKQTRNMA